MNVIHRLLRMLGHGPLALCVLAFCASLRAQVASPFDSLPYQGFLADADGVGLGTPAPVNFDIIFRIYSSESGGSLVWSEQQTVTLDRGQFSVALGVGGRVGAEPRPDLSSVFRSLSASQRHVELTIKGIGPGGVDNVVLPRVRLLASPYAQVARHAITARSLLAGADASALSVVGTQVGINTTQPASTLDVRGNIRSTGLEVTGSLDVAGTVTAEAWDGLGIVPVGTIVLWSGDIAPDDWALCNGQTINGVQTPDLRGRFVLGVGQGAGLSERSIGDRGGAEEHRLTLAEMPRHAHRFTPSGIRTTESDGGHFHSLMSEFTEKKGPPGIQPEGRRYWDPSLLAHVPSDNQTSFAGDHHHQVDLASAETTSAGGNQPHSNVPPFYALAYIMRVR